jgi:hypothetical protein
VTTSKRASGLRRAQLSWVVVMYRELYPVVEQEATNSSSTMDAEYQACGSAARGLSMLKMLNELALLSSDFPLKGPFILCDIKPALSLCKDGPQGGQRELKHVFSFYTLLVIMLSVANCIYCIASRRTTSMTS